MVLVIVRRLYQIRRPIAVVSRCLYSTRISKPLRILFCGSDEFSCTSLKAVHQEQLRSPQSIASIDVLVRPGKPTGRGLKSIREVPIKSVAQDLGLAIHERDTFTGWMLPQPDGEPINLIIAVSFGLFVPPRILKSAEYGGINLHPSLLPDFRGPAPLHHILLAGETHTGVTLQTLHPEKFDHGTILAQTPSPGLHIPNPSNCTYQELLDFITPKAADMLVQGIRDRLFILDSYRQGSRQHSASSHGRASFSAVNNSRPLRHAPKITTEDRHIAWNTMTAEEILRRDRVLGRLWSFCEPEGKQKTRIVFGKIENIRDTRPHFSWPWNLSHTAVGMPPGNVKDRFDSENLSKAFLLPLTSSDDRRYLVPVLEDGNAIILRAANNGAVLIKEITVEGEKKKNAAKALSGWTRSSILDGDLESSHVLS